MAKLTFHGHATFSIETEDGTRIVIDPWFDENPVSDVTSEEVGEVDYIFCTHGHTDHFEDAIPLAKRTGATLVASAEIAGFAETQGVENVHPMHIGGAFQFPFGRAKMTPALHGGQVHGDETGTFTTVPGGFLLNVDGVGVYHAGDTALLGDMRFLEGQVDFALLPIGDNFTMGPDDAVRATELIHPRVVVPMHFNTWEPIAQDPEAFRKMMGDRARVEVMEPGDTIPLG